MTRQSGFTVCREEMDLPAVPASIGARYFLHESARPPVTRLLQMLLALLTVVERCCLLLGHLHCVSHAVLVKRPQAISVIFLSSLNGATG